MMERKQQLMGKVPELREKCAKIFGSCMSAEDVKDLLEKKQALEDLLEERKRTQVESWRDTRRRTWRSSSCCGTATICASIVC